MRSQRKKKIAQYTKDLKKKYRGEIRIRHRPSQSDAATGVLTANLEGHVFRKTKEPQTVKNRSRQSSTTLNTSDASSVAASSVTSSTASPSTSKTKRNRRAPDYFGFESSVCSISDDSAPAPKRHKTANPVIETIIHKGASKPPATETYFELPVVSLLAPPPVETWSPESYEYEDYVREISMSVFDAENQI